MASPLTCNLTTPQRHILFPIHHDDTKSTIRVTSSNKIISALLGFCAGNSPVTVEFPWQRPVTRSFHAFFDLCLNKRLSIQSKRWWFEMPSRPLWRLCNVNDCICRIRMLYKPLIAVNGMLFAFISISLLSWKWKMYIFFYQKRRVNSGPRHRRCLLSQEGRHSLYFEWAPCDIHLISFVYVPLSPD